MAHDQLRGPLRAGDGVCALRDPASIVFWSAVSDRAGGDLDPIFFVAIGLVLSQGLHLLDLDADPHLIKLIAEVTLVWVLFADASRVRLADFRADLSRYARLLALGLPLTIALGAFAASCLLGISPWYALLIGAALAPTDAALGSAVMSDRRVPKRIRQTLNVESGLNDGIATPVVMVALAGIRSRPDRAPTAGAHSSASSLGRCGHTVGGGGGLLLRETRRRGWSCGGVRRSRAPRPGPARLPGVRRVGANGFVAAFVGGIAFGATRRRGAAKARCTTSSRPAAWPRWWPGCSSERWRFRHLTTSLSWPVVAYAVLSLTVIRMLPVACASWARAWAAVTTAFVGWFGPRGLASVVFALIALEDLHACRARSHIVVGTIGLTVLLSVLAHGLSARPLAGRYGRSRADQTATRSTRAELYGGWCPRPS